MPYNFAADSFHTKKLCSRLSSSEVRFFTEIGRFAFLRPPFGGLKGNVRRSFAAPCEFGLYKCHYYYYHHHHHHHHHHHLRLIGKRVVDFLLVLIEFFFARCYG